ncbi:protein phosphatase 2C domain-containing protein [Granulicoccus sp. GXG6511]|uniref:protein phosphatase 2C domain-containing protein n=1 Tax=Granulicoccus sp. GXG6511 TaxID=3381351 RepID=UPI003D7DF9A6
MSSRFASFGELGRLLPIPQRVTQQPVDPCAHVPDTAVEWADLPGLTVRGVSVRGHSHRWEGAVRQDQLAVGEIDDLLVCAVADGLGSQPDSHLGSAVAARFVAAWPKVGDLVSLQAAEFDCQEISASLEATADARGVAAVSLSTTLTFAAIQRDPVAAEDGTSRWRVAVGQIGDSPAYLLRNGTWTPIAGTGQDEATLSNVVDPLPQHARATVWHVDAQPGDVLALATDGAGNLLEDVPEFAEAIGGRWADRPLSPSELLYYLDAAVKTYDDDRTLLLVEFGDR